MTNNDIARLEAAKRIRDFNQTYADQLNTIPDYNLEAEDLQTLLQQLDAAAAIQQQDHSGKTTSKSALRTAMADTLVIYTKRAVVKAHRLGNTELEQALGHPTTYYMQGAAAQAQARATAIKDLLKTNLATLTNISAADIAAIEEKIAAFAGATDAPKAAGQTQKVYGTDQIEVLLDGIDTHIDNMGNLIDSYFDHTPLASEFDLRSRVSRNGRTQQ